MRACVRACVRVCCVWTCVHAAHVPDGLCAFVCVTGYDVVVSPHHANGSTAWTNSNTFTTHPPSGTL